MKTICFNDIRKLAIPPSLCFKWVEEVLIHKSDVLLPPKIHMPLDGNVFCNVMPCIIKEEKGLIGGVKIVTRYPKRVPALDSKIMLYDANDGHFMALLDGNWITAMRTGAVAAHSISLFAKQEFSEIGIIGLGNTARSSLLVLLHQYPDRHFYIRLLKYKNQAELFIERFSSFKNIKFTVMDTVKEVIKGSHVVLSCATYFDNDICSDDCFDEGITLIPVHTRGFTNCDLFFDKIYADDTGHVDHFKNFSQFKQYAEVSDVMLGNALGRENESERILVYNIGLSIHDIHYSYKIYNMFKEREYEYNSLETIDLGEPDIKYWV